MGLRRRFSERVSRFLRCFSHKDDTEGDKQCAGCEHGAAFTLDRYAHVLPGMQEKASVTLEAILFGR
jgi:hypothetical protein